jgi:very-short-patch-repair endonuclease
LNIVKVKRRFREKQLHHPTHAEDAMAKFLDSMKITYIRQFVVDNPYNSFYMLDYYIPPQKDCYPICIELDGIHHLIDESQFHRDRLRDEYLDTLGIDTIRVSNTVMLNVKYHKGLRKIIKKAMRGEEYKQAILG